LEAGKKTGMKAIRLGSYKAGEQTLSLAITVTDSEITGLKVF
jgi:hypothetical protein